MLYYLLCGSLSVVQETLLQVNPLLFSVPGPRRSELKRMEQYKNQAEDQSSPNQPQTTSSSSPPPFGSLGIMRLPGRGSRRADPRLVPGVEDETIEASLLGDLAVLSISNDSHEVAV